MSTAYVELAPNGVRWPHKPELVITDDSARTSSCQSCVMIHAKKCASLKLHRRHCTERLWRNDRTKESVRIERIELRPPGNAPAAPPLFFVLLMVVAVAELRTVLEYSTIPGLANCHMFVTCDSLLIRHVALRLSSAGQWHLVRNSAPSNEAIMN